MKYIFRGRVILDYNEDIHDLTAPVDPDTGLPQMNMCKLVPEDFALLRGFMDRIYMFERGMNKNLDDIVVD